MTRLIALRFIHMIPVVIGVTLAAFIFLNVLPGNVLFSILGSNYTPKTAHALSEQLHLNQPVIQRYFTWLWGVMQGHLGVSLLSHQGVASAIWQAAPPTIELIIVAQIMAIALSVALAMVSIASRSVWVDRICTALSLYGNSVPAFVTGLLLIVLLAVKLNLVSATGWIPPGEGWLQNLGAISLPAATLAISIFPGYMRVFRNEMYEQLENEEYVTLARMKGMSKSRVIFKHVARNSALGMITLIGLSTGLLIGGAVIVEQIFSIPGIGSLLLSSILSRDATTVQGILLIIAICVVLLNLLTDILYAVFDPRVRAG